MDRNRRNLAPACWQQRQGVRGGALAERGVGRRNVWIVEGVTLRGSPLAQLCLSVYRGRIGTLAVGGASEIKVSSLCWPHLVLPRVTDISFPTSCYPCNERCRGGRNGHGFGFNLTRPPVQSQRRSRLQSVTVAADKRPRLQVMDLLKLNGIAAVSLPPSLSAVHSVPLRSLALIYSPPPACLPTVPVTSIRSVSEEGN